MKVDPCLPLSFCTLNAQEVRSSLNRFGFVRLSNSFSSEQVDRLRGAVADVVANPPEVSNLTWRSAAIGGRTVVQRISRINLFSEVITQEFLNATKLVTLGSWIFGVPTERVRVATGAEGSDGIVLVIKDPANQSAHRDLRWHRDETFTRHLPINPFVNCGLYLDASDSSRGGLLVLPGSHKSRAHDGLRETTSNPPEQICVPALPGDLVIHRADIWHRSGPHRVHGEVRRVLYANIYAL